MPCVDHAYDKTMTRPYGLAATLHDAVALAEVFGPGARIGIGSQADAADIFAPAGPELTAQEAADAARAGHARYLFAFGNAALAAPGTVAPLIEILADGAGTGFIAACLAAPWAGRTVFQGHLFENSALRGNMIEMFAGALGGSVALVPHRVVTEGAAAIKRACTRIKEQGRMLALIDAIDEADCAAITGALSGQPLIGGGAWAAGTATSPDPAAPTGPLAILSGARDRETVRQVGAARLDVPVFDLDFAAADPAQAALAWAAPLIGAPFIISSSAPPDRMMPGAPAAQTLAQIAAGLAAAGITRFIVTGGETAGAVLAALEVKTLTAGAAFGPLRWLHAGPVAFCIKPAGIGGKNLFLPELEPQIRLNEPAK
jgi:uncharacterized protein YgbK (DUF1537 family)